MQSRNATGKDTNAMTPGKNVTVKDANAMMASNGSKGSRVQPVLLTLNSQLLTINS